MAVSCNNASDIATDPITDTTEPVTDIPAENVKGEKIMLENGAVYSIVNDAYYGIGGETFGTILGEEADMRGCRGDLDQLFRMWRHNICIVGITEKCFVCINCQIIFPLNEEVFTGPFC